MARASGVLRVFVETELSLGEPNVDEGLVTWFDVRIAAGEGDDSAVAGNARVARIHVGEASSTPAASVPDILRTLVAEGRLESNAISASSVRRFYQRQR